MPVHLDTVWVKFKDQGCGSEFAVTGGKMLTKVVGVTSREGFVVGLIERSYGWVAVNSHVVDAGSLLCEMLMVSEWAVFDVPLHTRHGSHFRGEVKWVGFQRWALPFSQLVLTRSRLRGIQRKILHYIWEYHSLRWVVQCNAGCLQKSWHFANSADGGVSQYSSPGI